MELKDIVLKKGDKVYFSDGDMYDISNTHNGRNASEVFLDYTITKIERPIKYETIYETPKQILDKEEKEWLEHCLIPFKNRIVDIQKLKYGENREYLSFDFNYGEIVRLPLFAKNTMYKGMELDKKYTLKELGLFE